MKNLFKSLFIVLAFSVVSVAAAQGKLNKKILLTVNNEDITAGEFMRVYEKNNYSDSLYSAADVKEYLDLYINFKLKVNEAEALKMDTAQSFISELQGYRTQLAKPYFIDESVNEELLKEAYNRLIKDIRASHILIMVDENAIPEDTLKAFNKISNIRDEIIAGKDFSEAAVEYSEDPSARDMKAIPNKQAARPGNKGDLGYFTVFNMVYPFESAAYNTPVGELSPVIRTKFGYHILKVTDLKDAMGSAQVAHIFVALRPTASTEDSSRKTEKINNIYKKIQEGLSFEEAVEQYSEDKGSVRNKGQLSPFTVNRVVPEFVETVDGLEVGEISEPVKTNYGYHIIKLLQSNKPGSYEDEAEVLKQRLDKDKRSRKSEEAVIANVKQQNKFKVYPEAVDAVIAAMDSSVLQKRFVADSLKNMTEPVIRLKKTYFTQYDFAKYVEKEQRIKEDIDKEVYLRNMFKGFEDQSCLDYMDSRLEDDYPEFKELVREYHDGILLFNLTDEMVWTKAVKDTTGLLEFFNANRNDYMWGERVDATVYKIRDKSLAEKARQIIIENNNDGDIAKAFENDSITSVRLIPDIYQKGDDKFVDNVEWKVGISEPVSSDVEDLTVYVKIKEVIPPQQKELDEAKGLVTSDYQNYLEKQWIEKLKGKYDVNVDETVLAKIIQAKTSTDK